MPGRCLKAPACPSCTTTSLRRLTKFLLAVVRLPLKCPPCAIHFPSPLSLRLSQPLESTWTCPCGPLSLPGSCLRASALHLSPATSSTSLSLFPHKLHSQFSILHCHSMPTVPLDLKSICIPLSAWQLFESPPARVPPVVYSPASFVHEAPVMFCAPVVSSPAV